VKSIPYQLLSFICISVYVSAFSFKTKRTNHFSVELS